MWTLFEIRRAYVLRLGRLYVVLGRDLHEYPDTIDVNDVDVRVLVNDGEREEVLHNESAWLARVRYNRKGGGLAVTLPIRLRDIIEWLLKNKEKG